MVNLCNDFNINKLLHIINIRPPVSSRIFNVILRVPLLCTEYKTIERRDIYAKPGKILNHQVYIHIFSKFFYTRSPFVYMVK